MLQLPPDVQRQARHMHVTCGICLMIKWHCAIHLSAEVFPCLQQLRQQTGCSKFLLLGPSSMESRAGL